MSVNEGFYDNAVAISYSFGSVDFGAGSTAAAIAKPDGAETAKIREIHVAVSETFTATTTQGRVQIGTASDATKFADMAMGTAASGDGYGTKDVPDAITDAGKAITLSLDGDSGAALDQLEVAFVAPTGGTPAGIGLVTIMVEWF